METERTWAGTYTFTAPRLRHASSIAEVLQLVSEAAASGERVRALGTRHSFNGLADTEGTLLTVTGIDPDPVLDEAARTVTVGSGIRYGELAVWLEARGWALHNMGSLPHISVGGATSTGTHGSGNRNGVLATSMRALELVAADGSLRTVRSGEQDFDGLVVGLGAAGIVVRSTLAIEPSFRVRQDSFTGLPWEVALDDLDAVTGAAYSVSLFTDWLGDEIGLMIWKTRLDGDDSDGGVPEEWRGAHRLSGPETGLFGAEAQNHTLSGGIPGPWLERLPHFRLDATPSVGDEIQTEYFVDRTDGPAALRAVRELGPRIAPHLLITELRTTAADELWLSGSYERETLAIHFTWKPEPEAVHALLPDIEAALAPFAARPHWGKVNRVSAATLARVHPRLGDARALFERLDPTGMFSNAYLEERGVREPRDRRSA
ncbi:FAD-binding protein [Lysinimonas soli]|uniref:FAD-binding protein n=1 Tax=Lysinimonas soli TaxID=1074233 RepID=A0ABW0NT24_9MICO